MVYRTETKACGFWLVKWMLRWKNLMPKSFLEINRYFTLMSYYNTIGQLNNAFSIIIKVFLGGKKKRPWSDLFIYWLIKQITNTYQNHFSRSYEIRCKGYMGMKKFSQACFSLFPRFMHSIVHWIKVIATPILVDEIYILIALSYDDWEYVQLVI